MILWLHDDLRNEKKLLESKSTKNALEIHKIKKYVIQRRGENTTIPQNDLN